MPQPPAASAAIRYYIQARQRGVAYPVVPQTLTLHYPTQVVAMPAKDPWEEVASEGWSLAATCEECELLPRLPGSGLCLRCCQWAVLPPVFEN